MIRWRFLTGEAENASTALASDEFLMNKFADWEMDGYPEPIIRMYTYRSNAALVGRFQNTSAEINLAECDRLGIEINRRMTGGGSVLMGAEQLMITLASSVEHPIIPAHPARILPKLGKAVIAGLAELGVKAEFRSKNDIIVDGQKICGTAICIEENGAFMYQASVLLDFNFDLMQRILNIPAEKFSDKLPGSFEQRMTTVARVLGHQVDAPRAWEAMRRGFEQTFKIRAVYSPFDAAEIAEIRKLEQEKYLSDRWIHQRQPAPDMLGESVKKTSAGLIRAYVALSGDIIKSVMITGDFFSSQSAINNIEAALKWGRADRESISRTIRALMSDDSNSLGGIEPGDLAETVMAAAMNATIFHTP